MKDYFNLSIEEIFEYLLDIKNGKMKYSVIDLDIKEDSSTDIEYLNINIDNNIISNGIYSGIPRFKTVDDAKNFILWRIKNK